MRIGRPKECGTIAVYAALLLKPVTKREEVGADVTAVEGPEVGGYNGWEEIIMSRSTLVACEVIIPFPTVVGGTGMGEATPVSTVPGVEGA